MLEYIIVLSGIDEDKWEEPEPRLDKVNRELLRIITGNAQTETTEKTECVTKLDIMSTERLGHYNPARPRPISVRFVHKKDVDLILANKKKLGEGIFVDRQYSDETESERKRLRPILTAARKIKEYRGRCKIEGTDLVIRGKRYSWNNLHDLPQNISTHAVSSRQDCSEQFIQACKASFSGDTEVLEQIMQASTPLECKNLGKTVKDCDLKKWNQEASELCYPGLLEKFKQNPGLSAFLKNTETKTILECCYDDVWGNGIPFTNPKCIDPESYKQQGILGEMLEKIRSEVINIENTSILTPDAPQPASTATATEPKTSDLNAFPVQM